MAPEHVLSRQEMARLENEAGVEFVRGRLVEKRTSIETCLVVQIIAVMLGNEASKAQSAAVFGASLGYRCFSGKSDDCRKPDTSVVRRERLVGIDHSEAFMRIVPDLAVEVVSENERTSEIHEKIEKYLSEGFPLIWVVEPRTKTITIRRAAGTTTVLYAKDEITGEGALPTFRAKVAEFFPKSPARK
jgi:Uma2 family endonuclease